MEHDVQFRIGCTHNANKNYENYKCSIEKDELADNIDEAGEFQVLRGTE